MRPLVDVLIERDALPRVFAVIRHGFDFALVFTERVVLFPRHHQRFDVGHDVLLFRFDAFDAHVWLREIARLEDFRHRARSNDVVLLAFRIARAHVAQTHEITHPELSIARFVGDPQECFAARSSETHAFVSTRGGDTKRRVRLAERAPRPARVDDEISHVIERPDGSDGGSGVSLERLDFSGVRLLTSVDLL